MKSEKELAAIEASIATRKAEHEKLEAEIEELDVKRKESGNALIEAIFAGEIEEVQEADKFKDFVKIIETLLAKKIEVYFEAESILDDERKLLDEKLEALEKKFDEVRPDPAKVPIEDIEALGDAVHTLKKAIDENRARQEWLGHTYIFCREVL